MSLSLDFPSDIDAWHAWQMRRRGLKARVKHAVTGNRWRGRKPILITSTAKSGCDVLVALDAVTPTAVRALLRPLEHLSGLAIKIASPHSIADIVPGGEWREGHADKDAISVLATRAPITLALGHYLPLGAAALRGSKPGTFFTVQHGLLAPKAPPLAPGTHLLAWSKRDAEFWRSGRADVQTTVVGSQLLWEAALHQTAPQQSTSPAQDARPVYLGQLHGAELDRAELAASTEKFCQENNAIYRPHPAEQDRRSRAWHQKWAAAGIDIDRSGQPLTDVAAPVVSAFSTGILEAAAHGLPAWAYHANPPQWLREFWDRYGMHQWGQSPTPAPPQPDIEPAQAIAQIVRNILERPQLS